MSNYFINVNVEHVYKCSGSEGIKCIIESVVKHVDVVGVSYLGNRRIKNIIKDIVEYIDVKRASCMGNRGN